MRHGKMCSDSRMSTASFDDHKIRMRQLARTASQFWLSTAYILAVIEMAVKQLGPMPSGNLSS